MGIPPKNVQELKEFRLLNKAQLENYDVIEDLIDEKAYARKEKGHEIN